MSESSPRKRLVADEAGKVWDEIRSRKHKCFIAPDLRFWGLVGSPQRDIRCTKCHTVEYCFAEHGSLFMCCRCYMDVHDSICGCNNFDIAKQIVYASIIGAS